MRVQNFDKNIRLSCSREEFIQLRMAMAARRLILSGQLSSDGLSEDIRLVLEHSKEVCDGVYEDMIQI
jgi:hypothetical protein